MSTGPAPRCSSSAAATTATPAPRTPHPLTDGAAYRPDPGGRPGHLAVAAGSPAPAAGLPARAQIPATDTWRVLGGGPWERRTGVPGVWTGSALVVTGGRSDWGAGEEPRGPAMPAGILVLPPSS